MNETDLQNGHAPSPETRRVTSSGPADLHVAWEAPIDPEHGDPAAFESEAAEAPAPHSAAGLVGRLDEGIRSQPLIALLAAGLLGLAGGVLAGPERQVLHLEPRRRFGV